MAAACALNVVRLVGARLGWQIVPEGSSDWDLYWTDTSISQERLLNLKPTQVSAVLQYAAADESPVADCCSNWQHVSHLQHQRLLPHQPTQPLICNQVLGPSISAHGSS